MNKKLALGVVVVGVIILLAAIGRAKKPAATQDYDPQINPSDFTTVIDNPYFSIPVGKKMVYEAQTSEGPERIEILVPGWTRDVMGVKTLVFWDRVYVNGELVEDTRDYVAQHKQTGDVWYFGEHVDNYENGKMKDHEGAWLGGVDGAKPGIWFPGNPEVGQEYRQEYYAGVAEDAARIESVTETVTVPAGALTNCVKVLEHSPLFSATAYKYHCRQVGGTALEVDLPNPPKTTNEQRTELVEVNTQGALGQELPSPYQSEDVVFP